MQVEQEAVRSLPAVIEAAAKSPLGLMALMVVLIAALGYAFFKEAPPRLKAIMFLVLFAGVAGFGFAVSRTIGSPASSQSSPPAGSVTPPSAPPPQSTPPNTTLGPAAPPQLNPDVGNTGRGPVATRRDPRATAWETDGEAFEEKTTGDHHCPDPLKGIFSCQGEPTRTNYRITLEVNSTHRLSSPRLECVDGPCPFSSTNFVRVSDDGRKAEASFDVWSRPTRWRLTAKQEKLVVR